jgi:hypothetical protein
MGDRAIILFTDGTDVSPSVYLHWHGSRVPDLLDQHKTLMASRGADVAYAAARFVGIVHATMPDSNLSLGISNTGPAAQQAVIARDEIALAHLSHGDAGVVIVNVNDYSWRAYAGYLARHSPSAAKESQQC